MQTKRTVNFAILGVFILDILLIILAQRFFEKEITKKFFSIFISVPFLALILIMVFKSLSGVPELVDGEPLKNKKEAPKHLNITIDLLVYVGLLLVGALLFFLSWRYLKFGQIF
ncbi:MAG: hypothetical protein PHR00_01165 [Patescibacteria group bacterium]|nr:hypothetical protein [Patescibacteria group bacterium]